LISGSFGEINNLFVVELASYLGIHDAALLLIELQLLMVYADGRQRLQLLASIYVHQVQFN
jgi:hypothetical protein